MKFKKLLLALGLVVGLAHAAPEPTPASVKTLRYAFPIAESSFDPVAISDQYSSAIVAHIFDALYDYDPLYRPYKIVPNTAVGEPVPSDNYKTWTVKIKPGIYFQDDPAFKGQRRELVAQDYVYSIKRYADPANKAPYWESFEQIQLLGLNELRAKAEKSKKPVDYEAPIEGLRALDRYTIQFKMAMPRPRFPESLAVNSVTGAMAREVVDFYGEKVGEHPVGTGPFALKQWRRSSMIVLERSPTYRERYYEAQPAADDAEGQALLARFKGRRLPMIDRVEVGIIEESQPRWLSFLNGDADFLEILPPEFVTEALRKGHLLPKLQKRGMQLHRVLGTTVSFTIFNLEHPLVGGYTPEKIALRRAISLGVDVNREITGVRRGQAVPAQSMLLPNTSGYDAAFKSENSDYDPARANALLDLYNYKDRDGDGWREQPDGSPLVIEYLTQPDSLSRQYDDLYSRNLKALHLKTAFKPAKWPENMKAARAGQFMLWMMGGTANAPDGQDVLSRMYSPMFGDGNLAHFKNDEFDALYRQMEVLPDGPQRNALFLQAKRLEVAYMPYKANVHRIYNDMSQGWLIGYRRPPFSLRWWPYVDIDSNRTPVAKH